MEVVRIGSQPSSIGPADWSTGTSRIDPLFSADDPAHTVAASVTFEPGYQTAWCTHPLGQTLLITAGCSWVQCWDGPIEEVRPEDVVHFAPGEMHWLRAAAATAMSYLAIQEQLNGSAVEWLEHVNDEQYGALMTSI